MGFYVSPDIPGGFSTPLIYYNAGQWRILFYPLLKVIELCFDLLVVVVASQEDRIC